MTPPRMELVGSGVKFTWTDYQIAVQLDRFRDSHSAGTKAELSAFALTDGIAHMITQGQMNLTAVRSRSDFARRLHELHPCAGWDHIIENCAVHGLRLLRQGEPVIVLQPATSAHVSFALNPLIYTNHQTLFYAPGGSLKSYLALYLALLACHGATQHGLSALAGPVLYCDWELNSETVGGRLKALRAGHPELTLVTPFYRRCEAPLHQEAAQIAASVGELGIRLLIVDSAAMACGGDLNSPDTVIKLTAALRQINCSSLVLAHISKNTQEGQDKSAYGSVFFRELARNVWELERAEGDQPVRVILSQKKNNFGPTHAPLAFTFSFGVESVQVSACDPTEEPAFEDKLPLVSRIRNLLEDGTPRTADEIAGALGANVRSIKTKLSAYNKTKWHRIGDYHDGQWTVLNR